MDGDAIDYETLTLMMEKRIGAHVKAARKQRSRHEEKERAFFAAAANEALFVWMLLASRMNSAHYRADHARLMRMVEDIGHDGTSPADARCNAGTLPAAH